MYLTMPEQERERIRNMLLILYGDQFRPITDKMVVGVYKGILADRRSGPIQH